MREELVVVTRRRLYIYMYVTYLMEWDDRPVVAG